MVVNFAGEIGIILLRTLEHDLGAIGELMRGQIDLAEASFANKSSKGVVADCVEVRRREFAK